MKKGKKANLTQDEENLLQDIMPDELSEIVESGLKRRHFLKLTVVAGGGLAASQLVGLQQLLARTYTDTEPVKLPPASIENSTKVAFIDG